MRLILLRFLLVATCFWGCRTAPAQEYQRTVSTIAELRALAPGAIKRDGKATVSVRGYHVAGDWGTPQSFDYATNSASTNLGTIFAAADGNRWLSQNRTNNVQDLRLWSAKPDGTTPIDFAAAASIAWLKTNGGGRPYLPAGTWKQTNTIEITGSVPIDFEIANGAVVNGTVLADNTPMIRWTGSAGSPATLVAAATKGAINITLSADLGLTVGDWIRFGTTNLFSLYRPTYYGGENGTVRSITGGTNVVLETPLRANYAVGDSVRLITPAQGRLFGGGRLALGTLGWGVQARYARKFVIENMELTGSQDTMVYLSGVRGGSITGSRIWSETGESTGLGYGIVGVSTDDFVISRNWINTSRHGVSFGSGDSSSVVPTVNRDITISENVFGGFGTNAASVDFHGNSEDYLITGNILKRGFSCAGRRFSVTDNIVDNPVNQPAGIIYEQIGRSSRIRNNTFRLQLGGSQNVMALRDRIERASYAGVSTNGWTGSAGLVQSDLWAFSDNFIEVSDPQNWTSSTHLVFVDAEANLPDTITFGTADFSANVLSLQGITNVALHDGLGLYLEPHSQVRWSNIRVARNTFGPLPITVTANAYNVAIAENQWCDTVASSAAVLVRGTTLATPSYVRAIGNQIKGTPGNGLLFLDITGQVVAERNEISDWSRGGGSGGAIAISQSAVGTTNLAALKLAGNTYAHTNTSLVCVSGSSSGTVITHQGEDTRGLTHLSVTAASKAGVRLGSDAVILSAGTSTNLLRVDTTSVALGGLPLTVGQLSSNSLASLTGLPNGTLAWNTTSSSLQRLSGGAWADVTGSATSSFTTITVNDDAAIGDHLTAKYISLTPDSPATQSASYLAPLYVTVATNGVANLRIHNSSTGSAALSGLRISTGDSDGALWIGSTNYNSSPYRFGFLTLHNITGAGTALSSEDASDTIKFQLGSAVPLTVTTNDFNVSATTISVLAPGASTPHSFAVFESDPTSTTPRAVKSRTSFQARGDLGVVRSSTVYGATNSSSGVDWITITLPALANDGEEIVLETYGGAKNFSGSSSTLAPYLKLNGVKVWDATTTAFTMGSAPNERSIHFHVRVRRMSATNLVSYAYAELTNAGLGGTGGYGNSYGTRLGYASDAVSGTWSAATNTLSLGGSMSVQNTTNYIYLHGYTRELK